MKKKIVFGFRQIIKMFLQHIILPGIYRVGCLIKKVDSDLVVFADAHHTELPFSMQCMYRAVCEKPYNVVLHLHDYSHEGELRSLLHSFSFMLLYARAKYVFICDNFLPAASCKKRKETQVIQLWHSCGLMKKMGYDTAGDIPAYYKGNVYRNYDLVTVSAPCCVPFLTSAMRQEEGVVQAVGVSRTDIWFSEKWLSEIREAFFQCFPEAVGKRILLWAPTFRGNASAPQLAGAEAIDFLEKHLGDEWIVIRKVHPHIEKAGCNTVPDTTGYSEWSSEKLLAVTDVLVTDYSSILFDYVILQKPFVLFAPDREEYERERGLYVEYDSITPHIAEDPVQLAQQVKYVWTHRNQTEELNILKQCREYHTASCDGHATERILDYLERRNKR